MKQVDRATNRLVGGHGILCVSHQRLVQWRRSKFYQDDGIDLIKKTLSEIETQNLEVSYIGGGKYNLVMTSSDYKTGEKILQKSLKKVTDFVGENDGEVEFVREHN